MFTQELHDIFNNHRRFNFPFEHLKNEIPKNGIYIIFEKGEKFKNLDRIVRVGSHTGNNQLLPRLKQHFMKENKNRSIFRKNIGRCFLYMENSFYKKLWELDITSRSDKEKNLKLLNLDFENKIEKRISKYIQNNLSFCVFEIEDKNLRLFFEKKLISTLAQSNELIPSDNWLGYFSPKEKIIRSGMWQVNNLSDDSLTKIEFDQLKKLINR